MYEGDGSRRRSEVASRVARLTEVYSYDEIKQDEKATTCDTCMRQGKRRDNLEERVLSSTGLERVGWQRFDWTQLA